MDIHAHELIARETRQRTRKQNSFFVWFACLAGHLSVPACCAWAVRRRRRTCTMPVRFTRCARGPVAVRAVAPSPRRVHWCPFAVNFSRII